MSRIVRTRTRSLPFPNGSVHTTVSGVDGGTIQNSSYGSTYYVESTTDNIGRPVAPGKFSLKRTDRYALVPVNGVNVNGSFVNDFRNYYPSRFAASLTAPSAVGIPPASDSMTDLLTRTNPSRPDLNPLLLLQDIVDIPAQLKDVGRLIKTPKKDLLTPKEVANQYLGASFGWLPLFKDVQDLFELQSHIHKRIMELQKLYSGKGLRRRLHLGEWHTESSNRVLFGGTNSCSFFGRESINSQTVRWGTVRWKPSVIYSRSQPSDAEIINQAKRASIGLSVEGVLQGAWELIPWTWVLDWFTNVGHFALQYSNTVPASPTEACIMTQSIASYRWDNPVLPTGLSGGYGDATYTSLDRYVGSGTISASLPFIGWERLSILSALFVQRFQRWP